MTQRLLPGRSGKMLARFPGFMRAEDGRKVLGRTVAALGAQLDEAERLTSGVQRAHRIRVADEESDVLRLAAMLGLERGDFTILRKLYDRGFFDAEGEPAEAAYGSHLDELRTGVQRTASLFLEGCGTLWALLEGAAISIGADTVPAPGGERLEHPDDGAPRGGFIHRAAVEYRTIEDGEVVAKTGHLYAVENPVVPKDTDDVERRQREWFRVRRGGFFDGPVWVKVTGVGGRTARPMVVDKATHEGLMFGGVVGDGQELVFALDGHAYLDGEDVTDRCAYFEGGLYDDTAFDATGTRSGRATAVPEGGIDRNRPRPVPLAPQGELPVLTLVLGDSDWRFSVEEGAYDASCFDEAVFALPSDPVALAALPPSGRVQLAWREHTPFAVDVLLPADLAALETELLDGADLTALVEASLERVRAAGIDVDVGYFEEEWVLNQSLLRDLDAVDGDGLFLSGTNLGGPS